MTLRNFQQDFKNIQTLFEKLMTDFYSQTDSQILKKGLGRALDGVRSFPKHLDFRVRQLSSRNIELVLPRKDRLLEGRQNAEKQFSEGALIAAGVEGGRLLWQRNASKSAKGFFVHSVSWKLLKFIESEAIFRMEVSEIARETVLAELEKNKKANLELHGQYYDQNDQLCGELFLEVHLTASKLLDWK